MRKAYRVWVKNTRDSNKTN